MQLYNSVTPSAGFDCWESGARDCRDNYECRDMQPYNSATPSAGFDCWEPGARGCCDNCECRDVQPYNSAAPSAGFDRWEPGARGLGVACIYMKILHVFAWSHMTKLNLWFIIVPPLGSHGRHNYTHSG